MQRGRRSWTVADRSAKPSQREGQGFERCAAGVVIFGFAEANREQ
jgi:hypothetical protein